MDSICSSDGTKIAFNRSGSGSPVVLVHGAACDAGAWYAVASLLAAHHTVIAVDRRGRGASADTSPYLVEREVEDIIAVLHGIGEPAHLLGHSSGAILSLKVAEREHTLRTLMLYEPPLFLGEQRTRPSPDLAERLEAMLAGGDRDGAMRTFLQEGPGVSDLEIDSMQANPLWERMRALAHTTPYDSRIAGTFQLNPAALRAIRTPTLLLLGGSSAEWVKFDTEQIAAHLPDCRLTILPGQEHEAVWEAPSLFAGEVLQFLGAHG